MRFFLLIVLSVLVQTGWAQQFPPYTCAVMPDADGNIELYAYPVCASSVQWEEQPHPDSTWRALPGANGFTHILSTDGVDFTERKYRLSYEWLDGRAINPYWFSIKLIQDTSQVQEGDYFDGGFVVQKRTNGQKLLAHPAPIRAPFGCFGTRITGLVDFEGYGPQNTRKILDQCSETFTAAYIADTISLAGHEDWYLPGFQTYQDIRNQRRNDLRLFNLIPEIGSIQENDFVSTATSSANIGRDKRFPAQFDIARVSVAEKSNRAGGLVFPTVSKAIEVTQNTVEPTLVEFSIPDSSLLAPQFFWNIRDADYRLCDFEYLNGCPWLNDGALNRTVSGANQAQLLARYEVGYTHEVSAQFVDDNCVSPVLVSDTFTVDRFNNIGLDLPPLWNGPAIFIDFAGDGTLTGVWSGSDATILAVPVNGDTFEIRSAGLPALDSVQLASADIDNDGDADLLVAGQSSGSNEPYSQLLLNDGQLGFVPSSVPIPYLHRGFYQFLDWNNDGLVDLLCSGTSVDGVTQTLTYQGSPDSLLIPVPNTFPGLTNASCRVEDLNSDGFVDLLLLGKNAQGRYTAIWENEVGSFREKYTNFLPIDQGDGVFIDLDQDGDLDLVMTGNKEDISISPQPNGRINWSAERARTHVLYEYESEQDRYVGEVEFTEEDPEKTLAFAQSKMDVGDTDNDGREDYIVVGLADEGGSDRFPVNATTLSSRNIVKIYRNTGSFEVLDTYANLPNDFDRFFGFNLLVDQGGQGECDGAAFGDYDQDGDLDVIRNYGPRRSGFGPAILRNNVYQSNSPPSTPSGLFARNSCDTLILFWAPSMDDRTATNALTYEVRIGTEPGAGDVVSPLNIRRVRGDSIRFFDLPEGTYYWSVVAKDASRYASSFAEEQIIEVDYVPTPVITQVDDSLLQVSGRGRIQWLLNGEPIENGNADTLLITEEGEYSVFVEKACGSELSQPFSFQFTNTTAAKIAPMVEVFPNPSRTFFNLMISKSHNANTQINTYDHLGRLVESRKLVSSQKSIKMGSNWGQGIYFLEVISGDARVVKRLVKTFE